MSKSAAANYETRLAELYMAGVDIGDYGHSRKLFNPMIKVACSFIDEKTKKFLKEPLPNTGMPPHFYVTADKSTKHRIVNQVTMICPVVNGSRQAIPLNMSPVYFTSDGNTGSGTHLAKAVLIDLKRHGGIEGVRIMQVQGCVTDGQYLNGPFVSAINAPIMECLKHYEEGTKVEDLLSHVKDPFWWPVQWDPGHWLDKVFTKHKETCFVDRLLKRVSQYHQIFLHGKMHTIAKETAKELSLPFRVTTAFAHQRFMSSSYLSLTNLAVSLEVYIESFKDHDNRQDLGYRLLGQDFCFDLMGVLDLLWPLVLLMLEGQAQWCPGWKFVRYMPKVKDEIKKKILREMKRENPSDNVCPWLGKRGPEIRKMKYGKSDLEVGWLVVEEKQGMPVKWEAREVEDSLKDLSEFGEKILGSLDERFDSSFPLVNKLLSACLDFGLLIEGLCGSRQEMHPVNKTKYAAVGLEEFTRCCKFVGDLPHIRDENLELNEQFAFTIYWQLKSTLIEVVWGNLFRSHFAKFFKRISKSKEGKVMVVTLEDNNDFKNGVLCVQKFNIASTPKFALADVFDVSLSNGDNFLVSLQEDEIIKALYNDAEFYSAVGQSFCILFDIMYAKTGTEAVVESFYRVVEKQEMDGGQHIDILGARSKVDWCLPPVIQCEGALREMAKLYIDGCRESGLPRHYVPVYTHHRRRKYTHGPSKVLKRLQKAEVKLSFSRVIEILGRRVSIDHCNSEKA